MAEKGRAIIISSHLNFPPAQAVSWPARKFRAALTKAGYAGMEYLPIHSVLGWQLKRGLDANGLIAATHQSFLEEGPLQMAQKAARRFPDLRAAAFQLAMDIDMVALNRSDQEAAQAQASLLRKVPHVVHPYGQLFGDRKQPGSKLSNRPRDYKELAESGKVGELQWQPTAEWADHIGVLSDNPEQTAEDMVEVAYAQNLGRAALDITHFVAERHGKRFSNPIAIARHLAAIGALGTVEFSVQSNLGSEPGALEKIMDGGLEESMHGQIIAEVAHSTAPGENLILKTQIPAHEWQKVNLDCQRGHELLVPYLDRFAVNYLPAAN